MSGQGRYRRKPYCSLLFLHKIFCVLSVKLFSLVVGNPCHSLKPTDSEVINLSERQTYQRHRCYHRQAAHIFCENLGKRLLRVDSLKKLEKIRSTSIIEDTDPDIWTDQMVMHDYLHYSDGSDAFYFLQKEEECYFLEALQGYRIKEGKCDHSYHYICEGGKAGGYSYINVNCNWREAKSSCEGHGWKLAIVKNATQLLEMQQWIQIQTSISTSQEVNIWVGLKISSDGYVRVSDDTVTNYLPSTHADHDCISLDVNQGFFFKRGHCIEERDFICEDPTDQPTEADQSSTTLTFSQPPSTIIDHSNKLVDSGLTTEGVSKLSQSACVEEGYLSQNQCICYNYTITTKELTEKLKEIKKNLLVEKSTLSSFKRQKSCAKDDRTSVIYTGCIGVAVLCLVTFCILTPDTITLITYLRKSYGNKVHSTLS